MRKEKKKLNKNVKGEKPTQKMTHSDKKDAICDISLDVIECNSDINKRGGVGLCWRTPGGDIPRSDNQPDSFGRSLISPRAAFSSSAASHLFFMSFYCRVGIDMPTSSFCG